MILNVLYNDKGPLRCCSYDRFNITRDRIYLFGDSNIYVAYHNYQRISFDSKIRLFVETPSSTNATDRRTAKAILNNKDEIYI